MATLVNGRYPDAEVIVTFGDGWSYSKTKMDLFRAAGGLDKISEIKPPKEKETATVVPKKEDVKTLMAEMEITKALAEKALVAGNGELKAAYEWLIHGPKTGD